MNIKDALCVIKILLVRWYSVAYAGCDDDRADLDDLDGLESSDINSLFQIILDQ